MCELVHVPKSEESSFCLCAFQPKTTSHVVAEGVDSVQQRHHLLVFPKTPEVCFLLFSVLSFLWLVFRIFRLFVNKTVDDFAAKHVAKVLSFFFKPPKTKLWNLKGTNVRCVLALWAKAGFIGTMSPGKQTFTVISDSVYFLPSRFLGSEAEVGCGGGGTSRGRSAPSGNPITTWAGNRSWTRGFYSLSSRVKRNWTTQSSNQSLLPVTRKKRSTVVLKGEKLALGLVRTASANASSDPESESKRGQKWRFLDVNVGSELRPENEQKPQKKSVAGGSSGNGSRPWHQRFLFLPHAGAVSCFQPDLNHTPTSSIPAAAIFL